MFKPSKFYTFNILPKSPNHWVTTSPRQPSGGQDKPFDTLSRSSSYSGQVEWGSGTNQVQDHINRVGGDLVSSSRDDLVADIVTLVNQRVH